MQENPESSTLFQRGSVSVKLRLKPSEQIVQLLKKTIWGTKGSRYTHLHIEKRITEQLNPYFISLEKGGKLLAVVCMSYRLCESQFTDVNTYYVRYFAFADTLQSSDKHDRESKKHGFFRSFMVKLFEQPLGSLPQNYGENLKLPSAYYAYVDLKNVRSTSFIHQMGFNDFGTFQTGLFTRFNPKKSARVEQTKFASLKPRTSSSGWDKSYAFYSKEFQSGNDGVFMIEKEGKVLVACRLAKANWRIESTGNTLEDYAIKQLQVLPAIRNTINPNDFKFLAFDYLNASQEATRNDFMELFESVLAHYNTQFAMYFIDTRDPLIELLETKSGSGLIAKTIGSHHGGLVARWVENSNSPNNWNNLPWFFHSLDAT